MTTTLKRIHGALIAVSLALPAASMGQNEPAAAEPSPTSVERSSTALLSAADRKFVSDAATGGLLEVELGKLAVKSEANIIKLPNISASIPQLKAAIKEL